MQIELYTLCRERYLHKCHEPSYAIPTYALSATGIDVVNVLRKEMHHMGFVKIKTLTNCG